MKSTEAINAFRYALSGNRDQLISAIRCLEASERAARRHSLADRIRKLLEQHAGPTSSLVALPNCSDGVCAINPTRTLGTLLLPDDVRQSLELLKREHDRREVLLANNLRPRTKLLFHGPPGNGKTAAAEALASLLGVPLLYAEHSQIADSHFGTSAKNLVKVFSDAARQPCVLFIDEIDALAESRAAGTSGADKEANRMVTQLLMSLDAMPPTCTFIAATNRLDCLDPALFRRFDTKLEFPPPSDRQVAIFIDTLCRRHPILRGSLSALRFDESTPRPSFAEIETILQNKARELIAAA